MIRVADVTHLFNPDWDQLIADVQSIKEDRVVLGDWGGWGILTKYGGSREGFGTGNYMMHDDGSASSIEPVRINGAEHLTWSSVATPAMKQAVQQVRQKGMFPSRARITTLQPHGKIMWHVDGEGNTKLYRLHFVLKTNPLAFFETRDRKYHLQERRAYIFNTNFHHRITNEGDEVRIHLMMNLNMESRVEKLCEGHWL